MKAPAAVMNRQARISTCLSATGSSGWRMLIGDEGPRRRFDMPAWRHPLTGREAA
jgi:hypothetical protein